MLNNNTKILLVSFVHHIELQNFLNAPRTSAFTVSGLLKPFSSIKAHCHVVHRIMYLNGIDINKVILLLKQYLMTYYQ